MESKDLKLAFEEMVKCGLSEEKANQEIGFALMQINKDANLQRFPIIQINNAVKQVAYTGLSLNHLKQEAVISHYNEKGQKGVFFMPMYRGLLKTAILEGAILADNTHVVNEGDEFEIKPALFKAPVHHIKKSFGANRKPIVTYTVLMLPSGVEKVSIFHEDEYQTLQSKAKNQRSDSPHKMWTDEMRKKSSLKRALKTVPSVRDSKLDHLIHLDNMQYSNEVVKVPPKKKENKKEVLTKKHDRFNGVVAALQKGRADVKMVKEIFDLSVELEAELTKIFEDAKAAV